jgi:hypothetical protein
MGYKIMNELIKVVNCETGEVIERPRTPEERRSTDALIAATQAELQAEAEAKEAKAALLAKLGITADEAKLLLS